VNFFLKERFRLLQEAPDRLSGDGQYERISTTGFLQIGGGRESFGKIYILKVVGVSSRHIYGFGLFRSSTPQSYVLSLVA
jgi:hypothetical protein